MKRARQTLELLNLGVEDRLPWELLVRPAMSRPAEEAYNGNVVIDERLREWDYGDYEGLTVEEVRQQRKTKGLDKDQDWDIMRDGCEGGEYMCPKHGQLALRS